MTIYCDPHNGQFYFFEPPPRFIKEGELWENFLKYDKENPSVYERFKSSIESFFTDDCKLSSYLVRETMRLAGDGKVDNNFAPYYLRKLIEEHPDYEKHFILRALKREKL